MPPPTKYAPIKKRRSRRAQDFGGTSSRVHSSINSHPPNMQTSTLPKTKENLGGAAIRRPSSTSSVTSSIPMGPLTHRNDSDSDGACGFDSAWRGSAQL